MSFILESYFQITNQKLRVICLVKPLTIVFFFTFISNCLKPNFFWKWCVQKKSLHIKSYNVILINSGFIVTYILYPNCGEQLLTFPLKRQEDHDTEESQHKNFYGYLELTIFLPSSLPLPTILKKNKNQDFNTQSICNKKQKLEKI